MSIRLKLIAGAVLFLLLFVGVFVAFATASAGQKTDGLVINIAARQRTLTEKMTKELLNYAEEPSPEHWSTFEETHGLFRSSLDALVDGGEIATTMDGAGAAASLPKATDKEIKTELESVVTLAEHFKEAAQRLKVEAHDAADAHDALMEQLPALIGKLESVVQRAQKAGENVELDVQERSEWALIVRYASRQPLLAERITTHALGYARKPTDEAKAELDAIVKIFDDTHHALRSGGAVVIDVQDPTGGEMIAAAQHPMVQERLEDAGGRWDAYRAKLRALVFSAGSRATARKEVLALSAPLLAALTKVVDRATELSESRVGVLRAIQISALVAGLLLVVLAAFVGNKIGSNMRTALDAARTIASGDLTHRSEVRARDETGKLLTSLNSMVEQLAGLVEKVQISGVSVGSSTSQIAGSARRQESAVSQLASSATQIAATSTEIAATAEQLLETMNEVGRVSEGASRSAANSKVGLEEMQRTMSQMVESTSTVTDRLSAISQKTAKISTVVGTIMKIAQQTNLISLNAAIEAENAGELGLGFAVVAKEVRRLADQTTKASTGVEQMVGEMQSAVSTAVMGMDAFEEEIRQGGDAVNQVVARLGTIIEQVQQLVPRFETVREGMSAQSEGARQIAEGVRQIVESSEETAESVRQTNASIAALSAAAGELQEGVSRFKVGANGAT